MRGLSLVVASGGHSSSQCVGLSLSRPLLLRSTGSRCAGSVVVAHGPSCSAACGIFPDQGSNPCPLHWQADSQPLRHQGSHRSFKLEFKVEPFLQGRCMDRFRGNATVHRRETEWKLILYFPVSSRLNECLDRTRVLLVKQTASFFSGYQPLLQRPFVFCNLGHFSIPLSLFPQPK